MGREEHYKQILLEFVESACGGWTTLGLPQPNAVCTSQVYTGQAPGYSAGALSQVGPAFHAVPRTKHSGSHVLHRGTDPDGLCIWHPSQVQAFQASGAQQVQCPRCTYATLRSQSLSFPGVVRCEGTVSGVSYVSSGELISGCDPPG